ncbi:MAG TPA: hypothetical protein VHM65_09930 [Candidatus Lustribacter sp.]|nr:hypothetical protein [Candidatus Lustribacter sp.]
MGSTVGDRLHAARQRGFVGRAAELTLFDEIVTAADLPITVLWVHGPAGVGKSTLLRRYAQATADHAVACLSVDARDLAPSIESLMAAFGPVVTTPPDATAAEATASAAGRRVLMIDTFELLESAEELLRSSVLPHLPANLLVVVAGQYPPGPAWRADPGWAELLRPVPLENLSAQEASDYLVARGVADPERTRAVEFTRGHPLALALVSEVIRTRGSFDPKGSPDVIAMLVEALVQGVPTSLHRRALQASAQVRVVTEALLTCLLDIPDAADLFDWLRRLPVVDTGSSGLYLHDLAREVLAADLKWRHPERYLELHERARAHFLARLDSPGAASQATALIDLIFLHDELRPYLQPVESSSGGLLMDRPRDDERPAIRAMIGSHEGEESAAIAEQWLDRQRDAWQVVRDSAGQLLGILCTLAIEGVADDDAGTDPAVAAARRELAHHPPLRDGERATLFRFWMSRDGYQSVSPVQSLIAVQLGRHYLTTAGLALTLLPFADPQAWAQIALYADQHPMPSAAFTVGGRAYGVFGHDWRVVPPTSWLATLARREIGIAPGAAPPDLSSSVAVLTREDFAAAVRQGLRGLTRPDRLRRNPLLAARIVTTKVAAGAPARERVAALQAALREACLSLEGDRRAYRVLHRSFLAPAPTLEAAAEALSLPSSTFRRHLTAAVQRVVDLLWEQELTP